MAEMKKKLLFVMPSLSSGGGEKSLVNLLTHFDYRRYEVDLALFSRTGVFLSSLPKEVRVVELPATYRLFALGLFRSMVAYLKRGQLKQAIARLMFSIVNHWRRNASLAEQRGWKYQRACLEPMATEYDSAIGFLEKSSIYFVVDRVNAKRKIGWIHTNYMDSGMEAEVDRPYFNRLDALVTVSEECANALRSCFAPLERKLSVIYNIVSPRLIRELAARETGADFDCPSGFYRIVTVARLSPEKGIDLAIDACKQLIDRGYSVCWYVIGEGKERPALEKRIESLRLGQRMRLLGVKENPYPYIREADFYVQPSRVEGKSIAIDEAKILGKPILVTSFSTARDQISDGCDGLIVGMSAESVASGIARLIDDCGLRSSLTERLSLAKLGTESEIEKLYTLLDR